MFSFYILNFFFFNHSIFHILKKILESFDVSRSTINSIVKIMTKAHSSRPKQERILAQTKPKKKDNFNL